jgi:membrane-bound lytic murein transglycosylase D
MKLIPRLLMGIGLIALGAFLTFAVQSSSSDEVFEARFINEYNIYALPLPENLDFAGEEIPLHDPEIRERMDRELLVNTYWQSNGLLLFKRANKYFPIIEPILEEYGIPNDFKYLAVIESGLQNVVSPAGARGVWQLMPATAREFGMEVNDNVDERYHIEKSTIIACKYLLDSKERFGTWTKAAAAYNAGNNGISRRLNEQGVDSYYDLLLGEETGRYMFRILALKEIMNNPKKYGFNFRQKDLYNLVPTYTVPVDTAVTNLADFAKQFGINYKILKIHNPWLRENKLNNKSRKLYHIEIPQKGYYEVNNKY